MKIQSYITTLAACLTGLVMSGCGDFLDPKAKSEFVPKDATSLNELLLGEAYPLRSSNNQLTSFIYLFDDDLSAAPYQTPPEGFDPEAYYIAYTWQPDLWTRLDMASTKYGENQYFSNYKYILGCNAILDYIGQAEGDTKENIDNVLAQAHALRGFYYLQLVNLFGAPYYSDGNDTYNPAVSLGVPLKLASNIEDKPLTRSTVKEVYDLIVSDLTTAVELYEGLSAQRQWKADYRTSLPMAQLILSRTYLYMGEWDKAAEYAEKVMNNPAFTLLDLNTIPEIDPATSSWPVANQRPNYVDYLSYAISPEVIWVYSSVGDAAMWLSDAKTSNDGRIIHPYFMASPELMTTFGEKDLRKSRYVVTTPRCMIDGKRMPQAFGKMNINVNNNMYIPNGGINDFGRALRLPEAYLNYAEAKAMTGDSGSALDALNTLRKCRFKAEDYEPLQSLAGEELKQAVRDERRRELCFEGHRWFDLRRWGMKEIKHVWYPDANTTEEYTLKAGDLQYIMPIPTTSLELNPELSQNPSESAPRNGETVYN